MTLKQFIRDNRDEIDAAISRAVDFVPRTASCFCHLSGTDHYHDGGRRNDEERRQWVLNDEGLYSWARSAGCRI